MTGAAVPRQVDNVRGALWMLGSALGFTAMTVLIKFLGDDYPASLQTFYRQAAGLVILLPIILRRGKAAYATTRPGILLFRSAAGTLGMILSFYAFQEMPLADANALSFTRTLWLVPLAAFVVRETVGPLRIGAAVVGFLGVLLMVRPGSISRSGSKVTSGDAFSEALMALSLRRNYSRHHMGAGRPWNSIHP